MKNDMLYKIRSTVFGHAVADALGVPAEFRTREELDRHPITDMEGFGTYPYPAGCWSDDTSMSLAALDSLAGGALDYDEIMTNFGKWYYHDEYTPTGVMFDAGFTCVTAIERYVMEGMPAWNCGKSDERSNGNGSLMRIIPFVLFGEYTEYDGNCLEMVHNASALTHAHRRSQIACGIYSILLEHLLLNPSEEALFDGLEVAEDEYCEDAEFPHYARIFRPGFAGLDRSEIKSGGYVVDTLEAALWCLLNTDNYRDCVLKAVNLGEDTDTVAAIAGGLAGALYGVDAIPESWLNTLKRRDYIEELCRRAGETWSQVSSEEVESLSF